MKIKNDYIMKKTALSILLILASTTCIFAQNIPDTNKQKQEIIALIAYLQRLGTDIYNEPVAENK